METIENAASAQPGEAAAPKTKAPGKGAIVERMLKRTKGASTAEMEEATGWKPHSVRAFLSGLRKKGFTLLKEERNSGELAYRIPKHKPAQ